ncbi:MAG: lipid A biosynthesis acyltransferase [Halofilum sp. (in: g-proteobacteria)]
MARALLRLFSALPFRIAQGGGALLGWLHWPLPTQARQTSAANLARCYPQLETRARRRLVRDSLVEMGRTFAESAWLWRRSGPQVMALVREVRGRECLVEARRAGRGVLLATPHIGSWELAGAACGQEVPLTVMFRPPRVEGLGQVLLAARTRLGMQPVPTDVGGIRALHRALQHGEGIGLLPDQRPQAGHAVDAAFFGHSVPTMTLLSRFARRHQAPVIIVVMERLPRGRGFRLHYWRAEDAVADPDLAVAAGAVNREVERAIALAPAQYMWSYRRFRRRK